MMSERAGLVRKFLEESVAGPDEEKCSEGARRARAAEARQTRREGLVDKLNEARAQMRAARTHRDSAKTGAENTRRHEANVVPRERAAARALAALNAHDASEPHDVRNQRLADQDAREARARRLAEQEDKKPAPKPDKTEETKPAEAGKPPTEASLKAMFPKAAISMSSSAGANWVKSFPHSGAEEVFKFLKTAEGLGHTVTHISVEGSSYSGKLGFSVTTVGKDKDGNNVPGFNMSRSFDPSSKTVDHSFFKVDKALRDDGVGMKMLSNLLPIYEKNGYKAIEVHANIDIGGYVWARCGFKLNTADRINDFSRVVERRAAREGLTSYLQGIPKNADMARAVANLKMKDKDGNVVNGADGKPISIGKKLLLDTDWYGRVDLTDKTNRKQYHDYINKINRS
jgi:hypothetical protein